MTATPLAIVHSKTTALADKPCLAPIFATAGLFSMRTLFPEP